MEQFRYKARDPGGQIIQGFVSATTHAAARQDVRDRGLLLMSIDIDQKAQSTSGPKLNSKQLSIFTRQIATLLDNGVRIEDALDSIAKQSASPKLAILARDVRTKVMDGASLSSALVAHPKCFDGFYVASVKAAEVSGQLPQVAVQLADHIEARAEANRKIGLALLYPALLLTVSLAIIAGLLTYVVPDLVRTFRARGAELPGLTTSLIQISDLLRAYGFVILAVALGVVLTWINGRKVAQVKLQTDAWLLALPVLRTQVTRRASAQFVGTLAVLVGSGVQLLAALQAARDTVGNVAVRQILDQVSVDVREGAALSAALERTEVVPPIMLLVIASGERGGRLAEALTKSSRTLDSELSGTLAAIVGLAEPLILLFLGGFVMLLVLAIMLPIINLNSIVG